MSVSTHKNSLTEAQQQDRETMHRQMLSSVSHDLKTPLASMIGTLEIYQRMKHNLPEDKKDMLIATALEEARRLDNFINNILDMAKLESGTVKHNPEPVDVRFLIRQCLKRFENRTANVTVKITEPATHVSLTADSTLLSRVMGLLMDNALKYGPTQGNTIEISYQFLDNRFTYNIHDNGPGIPEDQHAEIFNKYTRIAKQDTQGAGTGLGLAICRAITTLHNGTISVRNHERGGALFTVSLPLEPKAA